jgi:hypothetical protein
MIVLLVIAGLDPAIPMGRHGARTIEMRGTSPRMTQESRIIK